MQWQFLCSITKILRGKWNSYKERIRLRKLTEGVIKIRITNLKFYPRTNRSVIKKTANFSKIHKPPATIQEITSHHRIWNQIYHARHVANASGVQLFEQDLLVRALCYVTLKISFFSITLPSPLQGGFLFRPRCSLLLHSQFAPSVAHSSLDVTYSRRADFEQKCHIRDSLK